MINKTKSSCYLPKVEPPTIHGAVGISQQVVYVESNPPGTSFCTGWFFSIHQGTLYGCQPKNRGGPPKSWILIGFPIIKRPFRGTHRVGLDSCLIFFVALLHHEPFFSTKSHPHHWLPLATCYLFFLTLQGTFTLPETNIAPENRPSQKETSIQTINFQGRTVSFRECRSLKHARFLFCFSVSQLEQQSDDSENLGCCLWGHIFWLSLWPRGQTKCNKTHQTNEQKDITWAVRMKLPKFCKISGTLFHPDGLILLVSSNYSFCTMYRTGKSQFLFLLNVVKIQ